MVRWMQTELTMIATGRRVSDDRGDVRRWSKTGISFESRVEESKGRAKLAKRSRRLRRVIEGRADIYAIYKCGKCENMCSETALSHHRLSSFLHALCIITP